MQKHYFIFFKRTAGVILVAFFMEVVEENYVSPIGTGEELIFDSKINVCDFKNTASFAAF